MNELLTYYHYLEEIPQKAIEEYQSELTEAELDLEDTIGSLLQRDLALVSLALFPILEMWRICVRYNSSDALKEVFDDPEWSKRGDFYRAEEIFDILTACAPSYARFIIGKISPDSSVFEQLMDSIDAEDKQSFVRVIKENACNTKCITGVCCWINQYYLKHFEEEYKQLAETLDSSSFADCLSNRLNNFLGEVESNDLLDALNSLNEWQGLTDETITEDTSDEDIIEYCQELLTRTERITKLYYYQFNFDVLTKKEAAVLNSIKSHPEVAEYFKAWDEEYQKSKEEPVEIAGQDEPGAETQKQCYEKNYAKYDKIFSGREIDPDQNQYIGVTNPVYIKEGVFSELVKFLCSQNYIRPNQVSLFVYRMTGREKPNGTVSPIEWNSKNPGTDILYLCRELRGAGSVSHRKISEFFGIDESNIKGNLAPNPDLKSFCENQKKQNMAKARK